MSKVSNILQSNFSDLHSEFSKLMFLVKNNEKNYNNYDKCILELNNYIKELEIKLIEIKQKIFSENTKDKLSDNELSDLEKDNLVLEKFKPLMLTYRMML